MNDLDIRIHSLLSALLPRGRSLFDDAALLAPVIQSGLGRTSQFYDPGSRLMDPASVGQALRVQIEIHGVGEALGFHGHQFAPVEFAPIDVSMHRCQTPSFGGGPRLGVLQQTIGEGQRRFDAIVVPLTIALTPPYTRTTYFIESLTPATSALQMVRAQPDEVRPSAEQVCSEL